MKPTPAEREERRLAREAERLAKAQALQAALDGAQPHLTPPRELGSWDVTRTRCWLVLFDRLQRQTQRKRKSTAALVHLTNLLNALPAWKPDTCAHVHRELKSRTRLVEIVEFIAIH